jgi:pimeloyl-ACP methyl ester carboxylesterase
MSRHIISVPGGELFVTLRGDGEPLLLINGLGGSHAMWEPLADRLSAFRTIAFDAPGTGLSPAPLLPPTIPRYARMILALIETLGYPRIDVLGYSYGGGVAQELARLAPDIVRRLVLVAATCGWGGVTGTPAAVAALSTPLRMYSHTYYRTSSVALAGGDQERDPDFARRTEELRRRYAPDLGAYFGQLFALAGWSSLRWLKDVRQPALLINGDDDPVVPWANGALLASRLPQARLRTQVREGHYLLLDPTSSAIPAIADFLSAPAHEDARAWQEARDVSPAEAQRAIDRSCNTAQPQGALCVLFRTLCAPAPRTPAEA